MKKTIGMLLSSSVNSNDLNEFHFELSGEFIENVTMSKYPGIHVDENLRFDGHVNKVVKIFQKTFLGREITTYCP